MADERISLKDIEFDASGRAVIKDAATVARLKAAASLDANAIKNIGCCSLEAQVAATDAFKRLSPAEAAEIKNIGCCSMPANLATLGRT
jgi:hypothetical protein